MKPTKVYIRKLRDPLVLPDYTIGMRGEKKILSEEWEEWIKLRDEFFEVQRQVDSYFAKGKNWANLPRGLWEKFICYQVPIHREIKTDKRRV
jgi:hypothetical protein